VILAVFIVAVDPIAIRIGAGVDDVPDVVGIDIQRGNRIRRFIPEHPVGSRYSPDIAEIRGLEREYRIDAGNRATDRERRAAAEGVAAHDDAAGVYTAINIMGIDVCFREDRIERKTEVTRPQRHPPLTDRERLIGDSAGRCKGVVLPEKFP